MDFEVYCDEALPDLFTSEKPRAKYLMIGSLWLPGAKRAEVKNKIEELRQKHETWGEIKWTKISPNRIEFYEELVDLFFSFGEELRFRCIAVDHTKVDMNLHNGDHELGFYKFYYQLLKHWIYDFNQYKIFCDKKSNRDPKRLKVLKKYLNDSNRSSLIEEVQSLPSKEVSLIQLCDLLLGAASSRLNRTLREGSAKASIVERIENHLNVRMLTPTWRERSRKFNIFKIRLRGGW